MPFPNSDMEQTHKERRGRVRVPVWLGLAVLLVVAGAVGWRFRPHPAPVAGTEWPTASSPELVLQDGRLSRRDSGKVFTGWLVERYAEGSLRSKSFVSNGVLEGLSEGWHTNGVRQVREFFVGGKSEGIVTKWSADGLLLTQATAHEGRLNGRFQRWHSNGVLAEEMEMRDGVADGLARSWHPNGNPRAEVVLEQGKVVSRRYWEEDQRPLPLAEAEPGGTP